LILAKDLLATSHPIVRIPLAFFEVVRLTPIVYSPELGIFLNRGHHCRNYQESGQIVRVAPRGEDTCLGILHRFRPASSARSKSLSVSISFSANFDAIPLSSVRHNSPREVILHQSIDDKLQIE
jgi:hypothetical protein